MLIIGPSGVGKSVILKELQSRNPDVHVPRSATTRERREGEGDELYHFVSDEEFDRLVEDGKVLEWAVVHGGARYATLFDEIIPATEDGKIVVREVDVEGFDSIRNHKYFRGAEATHQLQSVFILPESKAQLIEHIRERAPMGEEEMNFRLASMEKEMNYAPQCDHQVVNREGALEETIATVEQAIFSGAGR